MFWEIFYNLCLDAKMKPLQVVKQIGISHGSITKWKNGAVPSGTSLQKIADYFDVTVDYLLGKEDKKIPLGPIMEREEDILWQKICRLNEANRNKLDGYLTALLDEQHREEVAKQKNA